MTAHRRLVAQAARAIEGRHPGLSVLTDPKIRHRDPLPDLIGGHRPDIYGRTQGFVAIAEAKTDNDIDNAHTYSQVSAFIGHLEGTPSALFVFAVAGGRADHAKTVLRFLESSRRSLIPVAVYDEYDFWFLDRGGAMTWRLG